MKNGNVSGSFGGNSRKREDVIKMNNRGEVSQILNSITFDGNNIFHAGKSYL